MEILPIPLTSTISLYTVRKRPDWLLGLVTRLYADKETEQDLKSSLSKSIDSMATRRRCTIVLSMIILIDFLIPFTILLGLYVTRRRPEWFKNIVMRLYADLIDSRQGMDDLLNSSEGKDAEHQALENKYNALHKSNNEYALNVGRKNK